MIDCKIWFEPRDVDTLFAVFLETNSTISWYLGSLHRRHNSVTGVFNGINTYICQSNLVHLFMVIIMTPIMILHHIDIKLHGQPDHNVTMKQETPGWIVSNKIYATWMVVCTHCVIWWSIDHSLDVAVLHVYITLMWQKWLALYYLPDTLQCITLRNKHITGLQYQHNSRSKRRYVH